MKLPLWTWQLHNAAKIPTDSAVGDAAAAVEVRQAAPECTDSKDVD